MTVNCPQLGTTGRLKPGNQLFQIASTLGLARNVGLDPCFPEWIYARWFSFPAEWFGVCSEGVNASEMVPHIDERARVYLQDRNLFAAAMDEVCFYLVASELAEAAMNECVEFWALPQPVLGVHVRRGDNVHDPATPNKHLYHPVPPLEYYLEAIELLRPDAASVAVFGDDPDWNRASLPGDYFHVGVPRPKEDHPGYHDPPLDWLDWHLLSRCDSFVLSNSTFGLFAALVNGGDAIVPWPVYGPALDYIDADLMLAPHWRKLTC